MSTRRRRAAWATKVARGCGGFNLEVLWTSSLRRSRADNLSRCSALQRWLVGLRSNLSAVGSDKKAPADAGTHAKRAFPRDFVGAVASLAPPWDGPTTGSRGPGSRIHHADAQFARAFPETATSKNKLLARPPPDDLARLQADLRTIPFNNREVLHRPHEAIQRVVFPNGGVASVTRAMQDGAMVEIATVGREGLVGLEAFLSALGLEARHRPRRSRRPSATPGLGCRCDLSRAVSPACCRGQELATWVPTARRTRCHSCCR